MLLQVEVAVLQRLTEKLVFHSVALLKCFATTAV